jgi:5-methylcytosine-specific restriction endonuclease McrA
VESPVNDRVLLLVKSLRLDQASFVALLEWALSEQLVAEMIEAVERDPGLFAAKDALARFRRLLYHRTGRDWSSHDYRALFDRVQAERSRHFREPITWEDALLLRLQEPLTCAKCGRRPPDVTLHIDHIVPVARGGSSRRVNLQFLCAQHNLEKGSRREKTGPWLDLQ